MRIFITGASGSVGGAAAKHLIAQGHEIVAMSRSDRTDEKIRALGAEPVRCSLDAIEADHLSSVEAVIHAAAFVEQWGPKDAWYKSNVLGTQAVLDAAKAAGVKRFIHIGTEAALCHGQHLRGADETYPLAPNSPYPYCATKAQAEARVIAASTPGFETIVLRPRFVWGPGDTTLLPAIEKMVASGQWMWINGGKARTSTTHIDNLVAAIELALTKGKPGEAYFVLDDGEHTLREMISGMAASKGLRLPDNSVPTFLADFIGAASETVWRTFDLKRDPPLTRHAAMVMSRDCTLTDAKARAELGYAPVISVADGLERLGSPTPP